MQSRLCVPANIYNKKSRSVEHLPLKELLDVTV